MGSGLILVLLVLLRSSLVTGTERKLKAPAAHFLHQEKPECHFANGTAGEVRFLVREIYDRQEFLHFDSRRGEFEAVTEFGRKQAQEWNRQPEILAYNRAQVDSLCRRNYGVMQMGQMVGRKVQPLVRISPTKADALAHHTLLICTATGYYPSKVEIKWLKNGQEQTEGLGYADELRNGDWTFQSQVMLQTVPQRGDVYTCQVGHSSLKEPVTVQWEPRKSNSAKSKVWTGAVGAVLGVVFLAVGLSLYLKSKKATAQPPPAALIR